MRHLKGYKLFEGKLKDDLYLIKQDMIDIIYSHVTTADLFETDPSKWCALIQAFSETKPDFTNLDLSNPIVMRGTTEMAARNSWNGEYDVFVYKLYNGNGNRYQGWLVTDFIKYMGLDDDLALVCYLAVYLKGEEDVLTKVLNKYFKIGWEDVEL